jgi:cell division protein FtsX
MQQHRVVQTFINLFKKKSQAEQTNPLYNSEIIVTEEQETPPQMRNQSDNLFSIKDYDKVRLTSIEQNKQEAFMNRFQSSNNIVPEIKNKVAIVDQ